MNISSIFTLLSALWAPPTLMKNCIKGEQVIVKEQSSGLVEPAEFTPHVLLSHNQVVFSVTLKLSGWVSGAGGPKCRDGRQGQSDADIF